MTTPQTSVREEFHKFSLYMAEAQEAGDLKSKDIEANIVAFFLNRFDQELEGLEKKANKAITKWEDDYEDERAAYEVVLDLLSTLRNNLKK